MHVRLRLEQRSPLISISLLNTGHAKSTTIAGQEVIMSIFLICHSYHDAIVETLDDFEKQLLENSRASLVHFVILLTLKTSERMTKG